jgi:glycosyltransferase involved in cell wall biosynthesis
VRGVCFFGGFAEGYPRSEVIRKGLDALGVRVIICRASRRQRVWRRYPVLLWRYLRTPRDHDVLFVPEFRHKDVPLAVALAKATNKICVFDPLVSRYDTRVGDRGDARAGSLQAWHNRNLDRWSMRLPDLVLADTSAHAEYYRREFAGRGSRVEVLPVGYDDSLFSPVGESVSGEGEQTVLFFGNYLPLHGVDTIVAAAALLAGVRSIRFDLIGDGQTFPGVERFVRERNLTNVRLSPRVPMEALPARIASAAVCLGIFGSTDKARRVVPNKVYQCMGMGKAVVTERSAAVEEFFRDGQDIVLVPPADPAALAEALGSLCRNPQIRAGIGANALAVATRSFTSRRIAERFLAVCGSVVGERRKGGYETEGTGCKDAGGPPGCGC